MRIYENSKSLVLAALSLWNSYRYYHNNHVPRNLYVIQAPVDASPLPVEVLINNFHQYKPEAFPTNFTLSADPEDPASITVGRNEITYVDPYTGEILGSGNQGIRKLFRVMTDLHRWLALSGEDLPMKTKQYPSVSMRDLELSHSFGQP